MSSSASDWHQLFDRPYRKCSLYEMGWSNVSLTTHKLVGAPFGGPLALVRDTHAVGGDVEGSKPKIRLFTAAGELLATLPSEVSNIVGMNWTSKEQLVVVSDDGTVILYSVHGERLASFSALPNEAKADGVAEVDFWPDGLVARTGLKSELWAITSWSNPRPVRLADALLDRPPTSMVVLGQEHGCEVMLATANGSIICVDGNQAQDQLLTSGPFARMALSPNGSLLAAFNDDGTLHLMSTDFKSCLSKFATGSKIPPTQLTWCDDESILLAWPGMLLLVGLLGDFVKFSMDTPFHLVAEFDGTRIVTAETTEWLSRVPESSESIFKPGSNTPAARLYDAQEAFAAGEARADDNLRELSSDPAAMKQAIEQCLHAAAHEIEYEMQRMLLKAASYGKLVCPAYKADKFTDYCRIMRVLNAVRNPSVGMPLTYSQYLQLEADVLVDRLVNRHQHLLAMRICEYLRIHPERVLVHWACQKIKHCADELSDAQLGEMIVKKLSLCPGISYSNIASTAFRYGKRSLATLLLEYEPLASDQVPLLMSMKEDELALTKAIQSGDTDLVYLALLHLKKHRKQKDFFALIREKPLARDLYISYCKQTDLPSLKSFYYFLQLPHSAADVSVLEAYECVDFKDRLTGFELALEFYEKDRSQPFAARAIEEEIQLLKLEREQEQQTNDTGLVDQSVTQLMEKYIARGDSKRVAKLKTLLKVTDKRMWYTEVIALSRTGCWEELAKLVANKKVPPIGYQPFIEACITYKNLPEAARYIARLPDYHEQMEWLCNIGYWNEAVDIAGREKDGEALMLLRDRCRQPMVVTKIEKLLAVLGGQGR